MITEDYVSLEIAKLLKEKGFECSYKKVIALEDIIEERFEGRTCAGETIIPAGTLFAPEFGGEYETYDYSPNLFTASAPCPTQAMAMKWLREVHNLFIFPVPQMNTNKFWIEIYQLSDNQEWKNLYCESIDLQDYSTYETACEAAIRYCLENLI